jgi:hypothetical protein
MDVIERANERMRQRASKLTLMHGHPNELGQPQSA